MARAEVFATAVLVIVGVAGCGGVERDDYVQENVALLDDLPVHPRATIGSTTSTACKSNDTEFARTVGYYTSREYLLPTETDPIRVVAFYKRGATDWRARDESAAPSVNLVRGEAFAHVLAGPTSYFIGVDHASQGCP